MRFMATVFKEFANPTTDIKKFKLYLTIPFVLLGYLSACSMYHCMLQFHFRTRSRQNYRSSKIDILTPGEQQHCIKLRIKMLRFDIERKDLFVLKPPRTHSNWGLMERLRSSLHHPHHRFCLRNSHHLLLTFLTHESGS